MNTDGKMNSYHQTHPLIAIYQGEYMQYEDHMTLQNRLEIFSSKLDSLFEDIPFLQSFQVEFGTKQSRLKRMEPFFTIKPQYTSGMNISNSATKVIEELIRDIFCDEKLIHLHADEYFANPQLKTILTSSVFSKKFRLDLTSLSVPMLDRHGHNIFKPFKP